MSDTVRVDVTDAAVDTLFTEDWSNDLDTSIWKPFGEPTSYVTTTADGRRAFFSNGDYNHGSGVVSAAAFDVGPHGLTIEGEAWFDFTGRFWQNWQLGIVTADEHGAEISGSASLSIQGPSPTVPSSAAACTLVRFRFDTPCTTAAGFKRRFRFGPMASWNA